MPAVLTDSPLNGLHEYDVVACYGMYATQIALKVSERVRKCVGQVSLVIAPREIDGGMALGLSKHTVVAAVEKFSDIQHLFPEFELKPECFTVLYCHSRQEALISNRKNADGKFEYISFRKEPDKPTPVKYHGLMTARRRPVQVTVGSPVPIHKPRGRPKGSKTKPK